MYFIQFTNPTEYPAPENAKVMHIQDLRTIGIQIYEAQNAVDLYRLAQEHKAYKVHFYNTRMPQRAVTIEKVYERKLFEKLDRINRRRGPVPPY